MESWLPPYPPSNSKDCSQTKICTLFCPQWCYKNIIIFPPPPPPLQSPAGHSSSSSALPIAVGVLTIALLLYFIIFKYCLNNVDSASPSPPSSSTDESDEEEDHILDHHTIHEPWIVAGKGLDESMIKSIAIFKYKIRGNGMMVQGTECSVCLSEFQEDESLKLLPNCSHPFHVNCIDTWLMSHSNCPLCRANIVHTSPSNQSSETPSSSNTQTTPQLGFQPHAPNNSVKRVLSDLGRLDTIIEIRDYKIRRTVSMDNYSIMAGTSERQSLAVKASSFSREGRFRFDSHIMNITPVLECFDVNLQHHKTSS